MPKLNFHLDTKQDLTTDDIAKFKERNSLLARVPSFTNRQLKALKLILCNVVKYQDALMLYTRRHEKLLPEPHNPQQISNKTIYNVVDKLLQNGLVTTTKGDKWYTTDADDRKLSTFKATPKLLDIANSIEIKEDTIVENIQSYVMLRDTFNTVLPYEPTPYTERVEERMRAMCAFLNRQTITYEGDSLTPIHLVRKYRDFLGDKSFLFGGRTYSSYMGLSGEERKKIKINGQKVGSFDYTASLYSIIYEFITGISRKEAGHLPYDSVEGVGRECAKMICNMLLNNPTYTKCSNAISGKLNNPKTDQVVKQEYNEAEKRLGSRKAVVRAVFEHNKPIQQVFLQGKVFGQHWSWIEANYVFEVAHYLNVVLEIPTLTVHDEFIVPEEYVEAIEDYVYTVGLPEEYETDFTKTIYSYEPRTI